MSYKFLSSVLLHDAILVVLKLNSSNVNKLREIYVGLRICRGNKKNCLEKKFLSIFVDAEVKLNRVGCKILHCNDC